MMQKTNAGFASLLENATPPKKVAKEILEAVTSEQPEPRHTLGDDAASTLETKRTMSNV
jgi:hypothetical protein